LAALKPVTALKMNDPENFEKIVTAGIPTEKDEFVPLNEILSYGRGKDYVHIHLLPPGKVGLAALVKGSLDGLRELARIVREDETIKEITATSWIVAEHPKLLERMGFIMQGEIDEEMRDRHFRGDKRRISKATISREEFLRRYLR